MTDQADHDPDDAGTDPELYVPADLVELHELLELAAAEENPS